MDDQRQRKLRTLWAAVVLAASVAALAVVPSLASPRVGDQQMLPDLDQAAPSGVGVQANGQKFDLVFDSAVDNVGDGPLIIHGSRNSIDTNTMVATQRVETETGGTVDVPSAGSLQYVQSVGHSHWHLDGFDRYDLRRAGSQAPARPDRKTGFCLGDRYEADVQLANEQGSRFLGNCEPMNPNALTVDEGMSVGWGDNYVAGLEGQAIDVTGLEPGRYLLIHRVNADGLLKEVTTTNNAASVLIDLSWPNGVDKKPAVKVLGRCPDMDTCAASSAVAGGGSTAGAGSSAATGSGATSSSSTTTTTATVPAQLDALLARQIKALRKLTTVRLTRARPLRLRDRALPAKRLSLELVSARTARRIARGFATTGTGKATIVSLNFAPGARAALVQQRRRPLRMRLFARLRMPDGQLVTRSTRFTPRRVD